MCVGIRRARVCVRSQVLRSSATHGGDQPVIMVHLEIIGPEVETTRRETMPLQHFYSLWDGGQGAGREDCLKQYTHIDAKDHIFEEEARNLAGSPLPDPFTRRYRTELRFHTPLPSLSQGILESP